MAVAIETEAKAGTATGGLGTLTSHVERARISATISGKTALDMSMATDIARYGKRQSFRLSLFLVLTATLGFDIVA